MSPIRMHSYLRSFEVWWCGQIGIKCHMFDGFLIGSVHEFFGGDIIGSPFDSVVMNDEFESLIVDFMWVAS